jgi:hypothetical protein
MLAIRGWRGTAAELTKLVSAVEANCPYEADEHPLDWALCPAHALLADPSALDHLLYGHRLRQEFIEEESSQ